MPHRKVSLNKVSKTFDILFFFWGEGGAKKSFSFELRNYIFEQVCFFFIPREKIRENVSQKGLFQKDGHLG